MDKVDLKVEDFQSENGYFYRDIEILGRTVNFLVEEEPGEDRDKLLSNAINGFNNALAKIQEYKMASAKMLMEMAPDWHLETTLTEKTIIDDLELYNLDCAVHENQLSLYFQCKKLFGGHSVEFIADLNVKKLYEPEMMG